MKGKPILEKPSIAIRVQKGQRPVMTQRKSTRAARYDWLWEHVAQVAREPGSWFWIPNTSKLTPAEKDKLIKMIAGHCRKQKYAGVAAGECATPLGDCVPGAVIVFSAEDPLNPPSNPRPVVQGARRGV